MSEGIVGYPFASLGVKRLEDQATLTIDITERETVLKEPEGGFSQDVTINLKASQDLQVGSKVLFDITEGVSANNITFADNEDTIIAPELTGVSGDRDILRLYWEGDEWVALTEDWQKINDSA